MTANLGKPAHKLLDRDWAQMTKREPKVLKPLETRPNVARNTNSNLLDERTVGERVADKIASFGGSWTFIEIFGLIMIFSVILNPFVLASRGGKCDAYLLLNLFLLMLAHLQAPVMMSQNRQAAQDLVDAGHNYEINLKAELKIRCRHKKWTSRAQANGRNCSISKFAGSKNFCVNGSTKHFRSMRSNFTTARFENSVKKLIESGNY